MYQVLVNIRPKSMINRLGLKDKEDIQLVKAHVILCQRVKYLAQVNMIMRLLN